MYGYHSSARHRVEAHLYLGSAQMKGPYLAHHGRKDQQWGVRHGPPYPLDRQTIMSAYGKGAKLTKSNQDEGKNVKIGGNTESVKSVTKKGANIQIDGKDLKLKETAQQVKAKLKEVSDKARERHIQNQMAKEQIKQQKEIRKEQERQAEAAKKEAQRQAEEEAMADRQKAQREALKQYYRDHPAKIMSARDMLTEEEINEITKGIEFDRKLRTIRRAEIMSYVSTAKDVVDALDTAYKGADNLKKLYNIGAETYNTLIAAKDPNDDKKPVRLIGKDTFTPKKPSDASTDKKKSRDGNQDSSKSDPNDNNTKQNPQPQPQSPPGSKPQSNPQPKNTPKVKYEKKIDLGNGQARYFYDQDEYKAYQDNKDYADKVLKVYAKSSFQEQYKFREDLWKSVANLRTNGKLTKELDGKAKAIMDRIVEYDLDPSSFKP